MFFGLAMDREAPVSEIEDGLRALLRGYRLEPPRLRLVEPFASANLAIG